MPRSYIQYCRSLEIQFRDMLFVTIFDRVVSFYKVTVQNKTIETARWDLVKGDHDRLIEVTV